jgi:hypothetical protein
MIADKTVGLQVMILIMIYFNTLRNTYGQDHFKRV